MSTEWFKVHEGKSLIGNASLDTLKAAVSSVIADYQKAHGRDPTLPEWDVLLTNALDRLEVGIVTGVTIALAEDDGSDDDY